MLSKVEENNVSNPDKQMTFNLRSAVMDIDAYANLINNLKGQVSPQQKECINEITSGSKNIIQLIAA